MALELLSWYWYTLYCGGNSIFVMIYDNERVWNECRVGYSALSISCAWYGRVQLFCYIILNLESMEWNFLHTRIEQDIRVSVCIW